MSIFLVYVSVSSHSAFVSILIVLFLSRVPFLIPTAPASLQLAKHQEKRRKASALLTAGSTA